MAEEPTREDQETHGVEISGGRGRDIGERASREPARCSCCPMAPSLSRNLERPRASSSFFVMSHAKVEWRHSNNRRGSRSSVDVAARCAWQCQNSKTVKIDRSPPRRANGSPLEAASSQHGTEASHKQTADRPAVMGPRQTEASVAAHRSCIHRSDALAAQPRVHQGRHRSPTIGDERRRRGGGANKRREIYREGQLQQQQKSFNSAGFLLLSASSMRRHSLTRNLIGLEENR